MYPARFRYLRPRTVDEALSALAELGADARVLAGGASLIPWMKYRQVRPAALIDIGRLDELRGFARRDDHLAIGALTSHARLADATELPEHLREVAASVGDPQVRNMGTIGGGLAAAEPTGDWAPAIIALSGRIVARSARGEREIPADEIVVDTLRTSLAPDELLTRVLVPLPQRPSGGCHTKLMLRAVTALASCSAAVTLDADGRLASARVAVGGVGPVPASVPAVSDVLQGRFLDTKAVQEAKEATEDTVAAHSDARTSAAHRRRVAGELAGRALIQAHARALRDHTAGGGTP